jgi:hypothetical protein
MDLTAKTKAALVGPDGTPIDRPATFLLNEEAELLRNYQRWGEIHGLQATMTCNRCGKAMAVYVQGDMGFFCDCRCLIWKAS